MLTGIQRATRSLFHAPGFTSVAILTIATAIGANTALFSIFDRLVLHPIDLPNAGRLVRVWTNNPQRQLSAPVLSVPKYRLFSAQQTAFSGITASFFNTFVLTHSGADPEQLTGLNVTASFVPTLGLSLAQGRNFTADEDRQNGPRVCLLSYDLWKTRFGRRADIVGGTILLDGMPTMVVGVLAEGMPAPLSTAQVLLPWPLSPFFLSEQQVEGGAGFLQVTARLKRGVSLGAAQADVKILARRYQEDLPAHLDASAENEVRTWIEEQAGPVRPTVVMLLTAVGLVLLIACANVSSLFLGRLAGRHKEIAVRLALGATRGRLVRQFLLESAIFCVLAAALGAGLAFALLRGAERVFDAQLQTPTTFSLDAITLAYTTGLSALSTLAIGLVPALWASRMNLADVMKDSARGTVGGVRGTRFRSVLIVAEVSLSVVLLIGSSLLGVSLAKLEATPVGLSARGVASAYVNLASPSYATKVETVNFYYRVLDALRTYPQVKHAAVTPWMPFATGNIRGIYAVAGRSTPPLAERPLAYLEAASEDYFGLFRIPLRRGRLFQVTDIDRSPAVCVINESFARRLFTGAEPIGQILLVGQLDRKVVIVGVVGDVKAVGLNVPPPEMIYLPLRQYAFAGESLVASTDGDPNALQAVFRSAVASVDKGLAVSQFATMDTQLSRSLGVQRVTALVAGAFAGLALLLSALGLYSVLAYAVSQRTGEIGIRVALGAERGDIVRLVLSQGMKLVTVGLVAGLATAAVGGRVIAALLYELNSLDPMVYGGVTALFAGVAVLACLLPSLRASRIEPIEALRVE